MVVGAGESQELGSCKEQAGEIGVCKEMETGGEMYTLFDGGPEMVLGIGSRGWDMRNVMTPGPESRRLYMGSWG